MRNAVLALSQQHAFARRLVNSGRLSTPTAHRANELSAPDCGSFACALVPGAPAVDAPVQVDGRAASLLDQLGGRFDLVLFDIDDGPGAALQAGLGSDVRVVRIGAPGKQGTQMFEDIEGLAMRRYDAHAGTAYLLRPDQHVVARWRAPSIDDVRSALKCAQGLQ